MKYLLVLFFLVFTPFVGHTKNCTYNLNTESSQLSWTAFKTTKKLPVKGVLKKVDIISAKGSKKTYADWKELVQSKIYSADLKSVDTTNPERDKTLKDNFFNLITTSLAHLPGHVYATLKIVDIKKNKNKLVADLKLNNKNKRIEFDYTYKNNVLMAKGSIDLMDFSLKDAHSSLHKACFELHKGEDGVSKTWSDVEIQAQVGITEVCK